MGVEYLKGKAERYGRGPAAVIGTKVATGHCPKGREGAMSRFKPRVRRPAYI